MAKKKIRLPAAVQARLDADEKALPPAAPGARTGPAGRERGLDPSPQLHDVGLKGGERAAWRVHPPQFLDQCGDRDHLANLECQQGEDLSWLGGAGSDGASVLISL